MKSVYYKIRNISQSIKKWACRGINPNLHGPMLASSQLPKFIKAVTLTVPSLALLRMIPKKITTQGRTKSTTRRNWARWKTKRREEESQSVQPSALIKWDFKALMQKLTESNWALQHKLSRGTRPIYSALRPRLPRSPSNESMIRCWPSIGTIGTSSTQTNGKIPQQEFLRWKRSLVLNMTSFPTKNWLR